jgi:hypothetical protein
MDFHLPGRRTPPCVLLEIRAVMTRKKLPIGIQTFSKLREEGCYYVDKTPHILRLIQEGTHYFLSRPRRFGKSLLIDTIAELFAGNEALFQGLFVHDRWDWSVRFPVVRLSFGAGVLRSREALDAHIANLLRINQRSLGVACPEGLSPTACFGELLEQVHARFGQRAVVLVDEYDKPILDNLDRPEIAHEMREGLRDLYSVVKDRDAHIKFAMLTGVSKFSKVSIFSGLNNLRDITLVAAYSSLCGYTEDDLERVFAPELEGLDRLKMRDWYNGYNWLGEPVYNPFDVLLLFQERSFRPWWFETGTPTFLVRLLLERQFFTPELGQLQTSIGLLSSFDVDAITPEALLFQAGYLTVFQSEEIEGSWFFTLGYPNREVKESLNDALLGALTQTPGGAMVGQRRHLLRLLLANDFGGMQALFTAFYSSIPHAWFDHSTIAGYEGFYASVFYSYFASLGLRITCEDITSRGRIDMTLEFNGQWYLFEFKVVEEIPEGRALAQIKARDYAAKYAGDGRPIHLIGVEFSKASRSVVGFEAETLR